LTFPISHGKTLWLYYTIEDTMLQRIKANTILVLDNKRYELEYTSPNIHNQVVYTYIANTKIFVIRLDLQKVNDV
jgi:hypothetical protein